MLLYKNTDTCPKGHVSEYSFHILISIYNIFNINYLFYELIILKRRLDMKKEISLKSFFGVVVLGIVAVAWTLMTIPQNIHLTHDVFYRLNNDQITFLFKSPSHKSAEMVNSLLELPTVKRVEVKGGNEVVIYTSGMYTHEHDFKNISRIILIDLDEKKDNNFGYLSGM